MRRYKKIKEQPLETKLFLKKFFVFLTFVLIISVMGMLFNVLAVLLNGGRMPVYSNYHIQKTTHFSYSEFSKVNVFYFTDLFKIYHRNRILFFSVGDFFIYSSLLLLSLVLIWYFINRKKYTFLYK